MKSRKSAVNYARVLFFGAALYAIAAASFCTAEAADWPHFRGPNRDGKSAETGLLKKWPEGGPELLWSVEGLGIGFSSVAVVDGYVYTTGLVGEDNQGILLALIRVHGPRPPSMATASTLSAATEILSASTPKPVTGNGASTR
jgi:hypothetical protein